MNDIGDLTIIGYKCDPARPADRKCGDVGFGGHRQPSGANVTIGDTTIHST